MTTNVDLSFLDESNLKWLKANTIFLTIHGSHAYGTNTPTSDIDLKGIAIPPIEYFLGFSKNFEQAEFHKPDCVIFDIRKFIQLAMACNPNVIEVLFTDPYDHIIEHPIMRKLIENRNLFISKKARFTFSGYAIAQLKRIKGHYKWLKNPPTHKPTRQEFDLPEARLISKEQMEAAEAIIKHKLDEWGSTDFSGYPRDVVIAVQNKIDEIMQEIVGATLFVNSDLWKQAAVVSGINVNLIELINKEKKYKSALQYYNQYQEWKENRNPERAKIEAEFGFDLKHAMHLLRLFYMAKEILTTGEVIVKRPNAKELLEIRNGKLTYEEIIGISETFDKELDELYKKSTLPHSPDVEKINQLCIDMVREWHKMQ